MELLEHQAQETGAALLIATHDTRIIDRFDNVIHLNNQWKEVGMNAVSLALAAVRSRLLHSVLSVTAAAAGIALLCAIFLLSQAIDEGLSRNAHGIDVVAGAKGSPIQLVLSAIYQVDVPNGNIEMEDYQHLAHNPQVKQAIPLALGDNYKGWRVVGTTPDYLSLYHAQVAQGRVFSQPFEAVAGARRVCPWDRNSPRCTVSPLTAMTFTTSISLPSQAC